MITFQFIPALVLICEYSILFTALDNQKRELDNTVQEMIDIALHNQQQDFEHHLQIKVLDHHLFLDV